MTNDDICKSCGHARVFHAVGHGTGVPVNKEYCDDRHSAPCSCEGFVENGDSRISMEEKDANLARYIISWLMKRNNGELQQAFEDMRLRDYLNMYKELTLILGAGGRPPNWGPIEPTPVDQLSADFIKSLLDDD